MSRDDIPPWMEAQWERDEARAEMIEVDLDPDAIDPPEDYDDFDYIEPDPGCLPTRYYRQPEP